MAVKDSLNTSPKMDQMELRHKCEPKISESIEKHFYLKSDKESKLKSELTESLVLFVALDMRPMNIINGEGFQLMANKLIEIGSKNPNIPLERVLPSDKTIANKIEPIYDRIKERLICVTKELDSIGITADHWTHDAMKISYITITIQYMKNTSIKSRVLATIESEDKTSSTIRSEVKSVLNEFHLNDKKQFYTTDNASSMKLAFSEEEWISCSAHNMNLLHKNSFKSMKTDYKFNSVSETIKFSKELVRYFKQSGLQSELETKLKQSISVRWDTKYLMLDSINKNLKQIKDIALSNTKVWQIFVKIDENILKQLIEFLKPFYDMRLTLCKDNTPTLHLVLPTKCKMILLCESIDSDSNEMKKLKSIYKMNIQKYFKISIHHKIATVLYPPLKELKNLLSKEEKKESIESLAKMIDNIKTDVLTENREISESSVDVDLCLKDFIQNDKPNDVIIPDKELDSYMNSHQNFDTNSSIISFWEQNKNKFPRLERIAKQILSIPATNLSSERNFSAAGLTLTDNRSSLMPQKVNHLLFIRSNFDLY